MSDAKILSPLEAGKLFLAKEPGYRYRIYCAACGGWVAWERGEECPGCGQPSPEAHALNSGVRQARLSLAPTDKREV